MGNYAITYVPGNLHINQRALTIVANNQSKTYGDAFTFAGKGGTDGGTNPVFAARMRPPEIFDTDGRVQTASATSSVAPSHAERSSRF